MKDEWCVALYDLDGGLLFTEIVRGIDYQDALDAARELWSHGDQDQLARTVRFTVQKLRTENEEELSRMASEWMRV